MRKLTIFLIPLVLFVLTSVFLYKGLYSDPRQLDSNLVNQPLPPFALPDLMQPDKTHTPEIFKGQVTLMNVWGVWCVTCAVELPYLTQLKDQGVRIVGLYYDQDTDPDFGLKSIPTIQQEVRAKLAKLGNPYAFNIFDVKRDYSLDLGVTGAPETYVIDKQGVVRMHHIGDINPRVWQNKIGPLYNELSAQ
ncbi:DsbE family thiol:disulfide interchange protein [Aliiglaciecola sp. LCG003]|uniref:DsbE family thiol:disulfide interchange protein n=1 Tax=Aliiglaciecola sp. LCG003 TaxID=3053655 RepID=UPI002574422E|nr:DsbE family thiol:disulfide interchange protein [Aliiglaciecola sp. LCG003]WJG08585.1 DsbE family thiol:disulfide interchange protein [Aliiglaciecola sp. LCG003]